MTEPYVTFLAVMTGFIPAFFIDGLVVQQVAKGRVTTSFTDGIVRKPVGVFFVLVEFTIGGVVAIIADSFFQTIYENNSTRLIIIATGVALGLIIVARIRIGGRYGTKETIGLILAGLFGLILFLYGIGAVEMN